MRQILLIAISCVTILQLSAKTIFVKATGNGGDGSSWQMAFTDLTEALSHADSGDQVWVAIGTYYPTEDRDRSAKFTIPSSVKLYGGFIGDETSVEHRNTQKHKTVLSGNIGAKNDQSDNSYTVIAFDQADEHNVLDGFIVTNGYADGTGPSADPERCGGGLYIKSKQTGKPASPVIESCVFKNNYARDGGGVYVVGRQVKCLPQFIKCQFVDNRARLDGGAIYNDGRNGGKCNPVFQDCQFEGNKGNYGGAICNYGGGGECSPTIQNCLFKNNEAFLRGGAIFNMDIEGLTHPVVSDCEFVDNKAVAGNGMYTFNKFEEKEEDSVESEKRN